MCLARRQLDAKSRRIYAAGNFCLFTGLMLTLFFKSAGFALRHPDFFLALRFALMCSAIVLLFWSSRRSGGCATPPERNS
jgi:hypothetical protein